MNEELPAGAVIGPLGLALTLANLPSTRTRRWTPFRKADVAAAVDGGLLSIDEACDRYELTLEELSGCRWALAQGGLPALRATRDKARMLGRLASAQEAAWIG